MSFLKNLIESDKKDRLSTGIIMPFMMPVAVICATKMPDYSPAICFLMCLAVASVFLVLHWLLKRTLLKRIPPDRLAILGIAGWLLTLPAVYLTANYLFFR